ncbi:hypothetical protein [Nocardia sp. NPDC004604]|uniref:hypothetical protein n=1 Tax=Nocardia sp. NPDC004604 TaxID=3157013 RepID=UPI0033B71612
MADSASSAYTASANATVKEMLDGGAPGLQYFEHYLPRYVKVFAYFGYGKRELCGDDEYTKLCAKYDTERDMDLGQLDNISTTLEKIVSSLSEELNTQRRQRSALSTVWQGQAGDAALNMLDAQVKRAETDYDHATGISLTLKSTTAGLRSIVKAKAETVDKYWNRSQPDIPDGNGLGRKEIDSLIEYGYLQPNSKIGEDAKKWLRETFVPHVEGTVTKFEELCKSTEDNIRRLYGDLEKALNTLDIGAYPMPADTTVKPTTNDPGPSPSSPGPSPSNPGSSPSNPGSSPSNPGTSPSNPGSSPTTTTTTAATTASSLLSGLSSLTSAASQLTSLGESVGQGLTSLGTSIKDGVENAVKEIEKVFDTNKTEDKDGDGKPDSTVKAEFDLAGKHLKLEIGADGQPKFVMTDADGKTHEYGVKLDDKGNLTVSTDDPKGEGDESTSGDKSASESTPEKSSGESPAPEGTSSGQSGTVPGVPSSGKREEDGEHYPEPMPSGTQPGEAADSGAELAEAGPL